MEYLTGTKEKGAPLTKHDEAGGDAKPIVKIDRNLNLVIPIDAADGKTYYVHAMPIARAVFEQNFVLLGRVYNAMLTDGLGLIGTRMASLFLKRVASEMGIADEVEHGLVAEMRRLANVLVPAHDGRGYEVVPWQEALDRKTFDDEDAREVENVLTFFMVGWHMHKRHELGFFLEMARGLGAQLSTSLTPMAYADSLRTSIADAPSAPKARPSSIPH